MTFELFEGEKIEGHYWIEEKDGDRVIDAWYPCYNKLCENKGVAPIFRYSKCAPETERLRLAYIAGKMVKLIKKMKHLQNDDGAFPFNKDLIRSGRCIRNVAHIFMGMTKDERKKWKICYGNMGWGEGEKYWIEFEEGPVSMESIMEDYSRIGGVDGVRLTDRTTLLEWAEACSKSLRESPLAIDEKGRLSWFRLGDNMSDDSHDMGNARRALYESCEAQGVPRPPFEEVERVARRFVQQMIEEKAYKTWKQDTDYVEEDEEGRLNYTVGGLWFRRTESE